MNDKVAGNARALFAPCRWVWLCGLLLGVFGPTAWADSTFVYAVQISAVVQTSPPQITLNWEPDPYGATNYTIYRKAKNDTDWGTPIASLDGTGSSYTDTAVTVGGAYEYQIIKAATLGYTGFGYIFVGINAPMLENRGIVVLVECVESLAGLDFEVNRLQNDLIGDGWQLIVHQVSSNDTPQSVQALIQSDYWSDPAHVNTVFLLGHVPILQSGYLDYDGHGARPMPADAYYGDVNNDWPTDPATSPSYIPSDVPLMVGRVDLADMPGNGAPVPWPSEVELLRNYLDKDHNWRQGLISVPRLALMGNRRGDEAGLATAASGYRNFEPFVGPGNTIEADTDDLAPIAQRWMPMLAASSYLWAYGCGAGQDTSISALGTSGNYNEVWSTDIVGQDAHAVFVMVFGSHLGNWDHPDNIMRSVLATPSIGLACGMSGEPHWFLHHMALGETIGYGTRLSLNNSTLYQNEVNPFTRAVYIALMGDPTLRMEPVLPPANMNTTAGTNAVTLTWSASSDPALVGYHVYRGASPLGPFVRLTGSLLAQTTFLDSSVPAGTYTYMVRAVALEQHFSGSYYDPSQGIFATVTVAGTPPPPPGLRLQATPVNGGIQLSWNSQANVTYHVEAINNLSQTTWINLSGSIIANGTNTSWTDSTIAAYPTRFYRVVSP